MTPPKKPLLVSPEQWAQQIGLDLANKVIKALMDQKDKVGDENYKHAFNMFLTGIIASFTATTLKQKPEDEILYSQEELMQFTEQNFINLKAQLQTSVANGVQSGIMAWSGQQIDYYCLIKPTPEAINTKPC